MARPSDWEVLAAVLMRRLDGKVELTADEIEDARRRLDPVEYETQLVSYRTSQLSPELLTVELRSRSRNVPEAINALVGEILSGDSWDD